MPYISFDHLADRFDAQIYGSPKGRVRQAVLEALYRRYWLTTAPASARVLDAGGGLGQMSRFLLEQGQQVDYVDVSEEMVDRTARELAEYGHSGQLTTTRASMLEFSPSEPYDLVMVHAVLEWMTEPRPALERMLDWVRPDGMLGLMVYNRHMLALRNLMRGNLAKVRDNTLGGDGKGLTPISPLDPAEVRNWLEAAGWTIEVQAGVRTFTDLTDPVVLSWYDEADVIDMELRLCEQAPYRDLGRYVWMWVRRTA